MNKHELTRLAYGSTLMDGGYTLWNDGEKLDKGFVVGGVARSGREGICDRDDTTEFARLFDEYEDLMQEDSSMHLGLGTWCYQGQIHFDVVELFDTESGAEFQCKRRGELAYYDIAKDESIYINPKNQ
jgi:hypothetical protein